MSDGLRYLVIYQKDGSRTFAHADDAPLLEAALDRLHGKGASQWTDAEERDSFVHVRSSHGVGFGWQVLVSSVSAWAISTLDERRADLERDLVLRAENADLKAKLNGDEIPAGVDEVAS
jgi:hypothetical protein